MNLPTLPVTGKGSQTGRVLLRRSGTVPPLPWSTFAPPLTLADFAYVLETGTIALSGVADELHDNEHVRRAYLGA